MCRKVTKGVRGGQGLLGTSHACAPEKTTTVCVARDLDKGTERQRTAAERMLAPQLLQRQPSEKLRKNTDSDRWRDF